MFGLTKRILSNTIVIVGIDAAVCVIVVVMVVVIIVAPTIRCSTVGLRN